MSITPKAIQIATITLIITFLSACSSSGGHYSNEYDYYGNSWGYDRYYRSGINRHYHPRARPARAVPVRRGRY